MAYVRILTVLGKAGNESTGNRGRGEVGGELG